MAAQASSSAAARNKLVVRRLPPTLPEDIFWNAVAPWITEKTCLWKRYVRGKAGDGTYDAHPTHSRAYVLMASPEAIADFHRGFDGHVFKSKAGIEYQAVVEFSPVQKTPYKAKVKVDARQGTIDDDPDYLSFIESLNAPLAKPALEVSVPPPQPTTTPLLEHLRTHAKSGTKGRGKGASKSAASSSSATESARRTAALASVTAAATKRAAQANSGPVMVAGKGREVMIASGATSIALEEELGQGKGKKGGRGKKKGNKGESLNKEQMKDQGKEKQKDVGSGRGEKGGSRGGKETLAPRTQPPQSVTGVTSSSGKAAAAGTVWPDNGRPPPTITKNQPTKTDQKEKSGSAKVGQGRGGGSGGAGGGRIRGGGPGVVGDGASGSSGGNVATTSEKSGGRGGQGGGSGRGRGGRDRSGRGQVMEILSRNTAGGTAGSDNKGTGGMGATIISDPGASRARIDAP